jgi:hypothetical protein
MEDQTIRTYLLVLDGSNEVGAPAVLPQKIYEITQFGIPQLKKYNTHTFQTEDNLFSFVSDRAPEVSESFITSNFKYGKIMTKLDMVIIKFWGDVSMEFIFNGVQLLDIPSGESSILNFQYDQIQISEKSKDISRKYYTQFLIPYLRDKTIDDILDI